MTHCVKSVHIQSYSSPHFCIRTEYGEILRISRYSEILGKMQTRITPNTDAFYIVVCSLVSIYFDSHQLKIQ